MQIKITNQSFDEISGYVLASTAITTSEDINLHDQIVDYVEDETESEYPLGKVNISAHEEIPHCYDFHIDIMTETEARQVAWEHHRDSMEDR